MKKRLAIMICIAMLLSIAPMLALSQTASAAPEPPATAINIGGVDSGASGIDGSGGTYTFDATTGTLTLDGYNAPTSRIDWTAGALHIVVKGSCSVQNIFGSVAAGTLTISGDGTLTLSNAGSAISPMKGLVVDGAIVNATCTNTGDFISAVVAPTGVTVTNNGKLIATTAGTDQSNGLRIGTGDLIVEEGGFVQGKSAGDAGIYLGNSNVIIKSGGSVEGISAVKAGVSVTGNVTVDGGTLTGNGVGCGIGVAGGDITLKAGVITGTNNGVSAAIRVSRPVTTGGKITVEGGTLTGENTSTSSSQGAAGIWAEYGMEIKGDGKVIGTTSNPGAAAVWVQGEILDMSGGELIATNTSTTGTDAIGLLAEAGITMTRNSKLTGTSKSADGGAGIQSWAEITLMGSDAGRPIMTGIGSYGIKAFNGQVFAYKNIVVRQATMQATGIECGGMEVANSVVKAESKSGTAIFCADKMDLSGENTIDATGTHTGIIAWNTFKARGSQYVHATATGAQKGEFVVEPYGEGISVSGNNNLDVDLTKGYIKGTGIKGTVLDNDKVSRNAGAGILFHGNAANVTLGANTKVEGGQILIDSDPDKDLFVQAYGKDGVVAEETVIYADVEYSVSVKIIGKGTSTPGSIKLRALLDQEFMFAPENGWKLNSLKVDGVAQTELNSYTIERIVRDHEIEVDFVERNELNVTVNITGEGKSEPGSMTLKRFENQTFTFTPAKGSRVKSVTVNGQPQTELKSYTIESIQEDYVIDVVFEVASPKTGDDSATNPPAWPILLLGIVIIAGVAFRRKAKLQG